MSNDDMVTAITSSIQTQSNLLLLLSSKISASLAFMTTEQLQAICTLLGIDYTQ